MTAIEGQRQSIRALHHDLLGSLDGMNYCLDWKPDADSWSAREIVYHLLDTPPGGMGVVVRDMVTGEISEYEIWSDRTNVTEVRAALDLPDIASDISDFFETFRVALEPASDADLQGRRALMHQRTRGEDVERTLETALAGFGHHWRAHLGQLTELREALGLQ